MSWLIEWRNGLGRMRGSGMTVRPVLLPPAAGVCFVTKISKINRRAKENHANEAADMPSTYSGEL